MSFLEQVKNSDARRQSEYFEEGSYLVEIKNFKLGQNRKNREFCVVETSVIDSSNLERHPRNSERSWLQMTDMDVAARNIRGFLCQALNVPDSQLTDQMIDRAFEPVKETGLSPLAGLKIGVNARTVERPNKSDYTVVDFYPVDQEQTQL